MERSAKLCSSSPAVSRVEMTTSSDEDGASPSPTTSRVSFGESFAIPDVGASTDLLVGTRRWWRRKIDALIAMTLVAELAASTVGPRLHLFGASATPRAPLPSMHPARCGDIAKRLAATCAPQFMQVTTSAACPLGRFLGRRGCSLRDSGRRAGGATAARAPRTTRGPPLGQRRSDANALGQRLDPGCAPEAPLWKRPGVWWSRSSDEGLR